MSLCKAPNTFRVGVSGAPVTSWDGYDTHYTERYMGMPEENSKGYRFDLFRREDGGKKKKERRCGRGSFGSIASVVVLV